MVKKDLKVFTKAIKDQKLAGTQLQILSFKLEQVYPGTQIFLITWGEVKKRKKPQRSQRKENLLLRKKTTQCFIWH